MYSLLASRWNWSISRQLVVAGSVVLWLSRILGGMVLQAQISSAPDAPAELSAAARDFRIEIYGAYRTNRAEYDLRRKQGEALLSEWQARGALPDEAKVLVRWFEEARRAASRQQALPTPPNWHGAAEEMGPLPPRDTIPQRAGRSPLLRALPQERARYHREIQVTAISADILRPRESKHVLQDIVANQAPALSMILALHAEPDAALKTAVILPKRETSRSLLISSTLDLPAAKLNPYANEPPAELVSAKDTVKESAELNTAELTARLRGYDKAWRTLQAELFSEEDLTLERATSLVTIMNDLQQARRDLLLYQAIAPAEFRAELRGMPALEELQKQLRHLLETARAGTSADHALTPMERAAMDRAWLKLLDIK